MSTILDALQKAQRERGAESGGTPQHTAIAAPAHRPTLLVGGIIALALLLIAGALWRIAARTPTAPPAAPASPQLPATQPVLPAAATGQASGVTPPPMQARTAEPATDPVADPMPDPLTPPVAERVEATDAADTRDDATAAMHYQSLDDVAPVYQGSEPVSGRLSEPTPADAIALRAPATATPLPDAPEAHALPADTPPRWNASRHPQLASLSLQVHVYDEDPARRWVMVDGRRCNEGGSLPAGGTLEEIRADGLVIRIDDETVWWPLAR